MGAVFGTASLPLLTVPVGLGEAITIAQSLCAYNRDEFWSKRDYNLNIQSMRIDILNTVREEMRDQVSLTVASLDNMMVVATLMLSIGFGFVVEGTYPPADEQVGEEHYTFIGYFLLHVYTVLCVLSLIFPFLCMLILLLIRQEVDICVHGVMADLQQHLVLALRQAQRTDFEHPSPAKHDLPLRRGSGFSSLSGSEGSEGVDDGDVPRSEGSEDGSERSEDRPCDADLDDDDGGATSSQRMRAISNSMERVKTWAEASQTVAGRYLGNMVMTDEASIGRITNKEVKLIAEGLHGMCPTAQKFYPWAQLFIQMGILSSLLNCAVLLGLNMQWWFPSVQLIWVFYSVPVTISTLAAVPWLFWMHQPIFVKKLAGEVDDSHASRGAFPGRPRVTRSRSIQHLVESVESSLTRQNNTTQRVNSGGQGSSSVLRAIRSRLPSLTLSRKTSSNLDRSPRRTTSHLAGSSSPRRHSSRFRSPGSG